MEGLNDIVLLVDVDITNTHTVFHRNCMCSNVLHITYYEMCTIKKI